MAPTESSSAARTQALAAASAIAHGIDAMRPDVAHFVAESSEALFRALATTVMRVVVLAHAEARGLSRPFLSPLFDALDTHARHGGAIERRFDAWRALSRALRAVARSPRRSPLSRLLDNAISDAAVHAMLAVLLVARGKRLDYGAAEVEQIGTMYEGLVGFALRAAKSAGSARLVLEPTERRRRYGSHYTPRDLTDRVVTTTLAPLFAALGGDASPDAILDVKVCDPAMGCGAFLTAACRKLGDALLDALRRSGAAAPDVHRARWTIARHCIYGVDKDPLAAELARASVWLVAGAPDGHPDELRGAFVEGDSLVGPPSRERERTRAGRAAAQIAKSKAMHVDRADALVAGAPLDWERAFPTVFARARPGFDAFIGNPPWVSFAGRAAQPIAPDLRRYFEATSAAFAGYRNLQGLFVERCARLLRPDGRLGLIVPSSLSELDGYAPTRRAHERYCVPDDVLPDFGTEHFDGVFQPCMALFSTRRAQPLEAPTGAPWPLDRPDLDDVTTEALGRLTRLDPLPAQLFGERGFQSTRGDREEFSASPDERRTIPLRVGGDIEPFRTRPPSLFCDPQRLGGRLRCADEWKTVRILVRQTARFPMASYSDGLAFRNSILAGFAGGPYTEFFLLAYLNAAPIRWFHYFRNRDARNGIPQVKIAHLRALPAPPRDKAACVEELARIGRRLALRNDGISTAEQNELDHLVADVLGLRPRERERVARWALEIRS